MLGRILVTLGGLLVVALFAALLAPFFIDWTSFRQDFESRASQLLGKKVVVHGAVSARILPFPSVTMEDVTVGTDVDGSPLVQIARFSLDAELAPFMSGEARIFDMRIEQPKARIRLLADGTLDWLRGSRPSIPARTVILERVSVTGGHVEFIDEQSGRNRVLSDLDADISARTLAGPWSVSGRASLDGEVGGFALTSSESTNETVPIRLRIEPDARPFDVSLEGELALQDGRPIYKGQFLSTWKQAETAAPAAGAPTPAPGPRLRGAFELTNESVAIPSYRLELGDVADPYVITGEAKLDTGAKPEFLLTAEGQQVDVNRLAADGSRAAKTARNGTVSLQQRLTLLLQTAAKIPVPDVPGRATLKLPAILAGDTVFRDIQLDVRPAAPGWTVDRAVAVLPGRTQVEASGRLMLTGSPSFDGNLLVASTQPSGLATWISGKVDPAIRQLRSAGFSATVNLTPELQRFEKLELAVGDEPLKGRLERESRSGVAPSLSVDLTGAGLDLDAARAIAALVIGEDAERNLLAERIAARLKLGRLTAFGVDIGDVDSIVSYEGDRLSVERMKLGNVAGASLDIAGAVALSAGVFDGEGRVSLRSKDPSAFLALLDQRFAGRPVLKRLAASADWYADTDISADIALDGGGNVRVSGGGRTDGSRATFTVSAPTLAALTSGDGRSIEASLENDEAQILMGQAGLAPLPWTIGEGGRLGLVLKGGDSRTADAEIRFDGARTSLSATGRLTGVDGPHLLDGAWNASVESADIGPYLMALGVSLPAAEAGVPTKAAAQFGLSEGQVTIDDLTSTVAGQAVSGRGTLDLRGVVPMAKATVSLDSLDLEWLAETMLGPVRDPASGALAATPLAKSMVTADLDLDLKAKQVWPGIGEAMTDVAAKLTARSGELTLDEARGSWLGGTMTGRLSLANTDGNGFLQSRLDVKGADLGRSLNALRLERGLDPATALSGSYDMTFVGEGGGASIAELVGGASGSGELALPRLSIRDLDLAILPRLVAQADALGTELDQDKVRGMADALLFQGGTVVEGLKLPFALSDHTIRVQNAVAQTNPASLDGSARLDLDNGTLEGEIGVALAAGDLAMEGAAPNLRLLLQGAALSPERVLDVTELTNFLSLRAFETERRRVEALQSSVLEKQRLRREAALARSRAEERARLEEEARQRAEAERLQQEEPPADPATADDAGAVAPSGPTTESVPASPLLPVPQQERVVRQPLPGMTFEGLPGVR
ncbi:AsmA-like C-terminal region-containing protein [Rhizobium sp. AG855]|uniref:AsmA family protein n=1 Tax=Rhizobium sp. AG855 TaxID=2183898 RepID=UPI000E7089BC|nr:AsmA-like C-terminal region-containing protein [Rhizobium sp. AG855]RKE84351.1 AsmA-like protein [Rhizobium sp. AG855]